MNQFFEDVMKGLRSTPKYLDSKYFYDKQGDALFQQIMAMPEYYLTGCEMEIFSTRKAEMADAVLSHGKVFDFVGFGPGDAVKSIHLMRELRERQGLEYFFPIDISENIITYLEENIPRIIPGMRVEGLAGEYLSRLPDTRTFSDNPRLVSFLGGNIGNFDQASVTGFIQQLNRLMQSGDLILIGFDLKKDPYKIRAAYDDAAGITARFNLNLLTRINRELQGNFDLSTFRHYCSYDPGTGACRSYLFSLIAQEVKIAHEVIKFQKDETIYMEVSQKYDLLQIDQLAQSYGFQPRARFFDSARMFVDVLWSKP